MLSSNGRLPGQRQRCSRNATVVKARSPENAGRTSEKRCATEGGGPGNARCGNAAPGAAASAPAAIMATETNDRARRCEEDAAEWRRRFMVATTTSARDASQTRNVWRAAHDCHVIQVVVHCLTCPFCVAGLDRVNDRPV